jgi:hypothetical protein
MNLPTAVIVNVAPSPPVGLAVVIRFGMFKKNDFYYVAFTDAEGNCKVSGEELLRHFDTARALFLMDYIDPRSSFDGNITAEVLIDSGLERAVAAFELFRGKTQFPENYEQNLRNAVNLGQNPVQYRIQLVKS